MQRPGDMKIAIIGGGVIGATIAYELTQLAQDRSRCPGLRVTLFDRHTPGQGATGAALGLCMGAISGKTKGRAWDLRHRSLQRYPSLLAELETKLGSPLPHNTQGLLKLCGDAAEYPRWQRLADLRRSQGYRLDLLDAATLRHRYPLQFPDIAFGIHSPQDWQIQPRPLTQALLQVAQTQGLRLCSATPVQQILPHPSGALQVTTPAATETFDRVILCAGLASPELLAPAWCPPDRLAPLPLVPSQPLVLEPVLGQGAKLRLPHPLSAQPLPVLTAQDIHLVPLGGRDYWLGATLEFQPDRPPLPSPAGPVADPATSPASLPGPWLPNPQSWADLWAKALAFWPELAQGEILETWAGARPRPVGRSAPVIETWPGAEAIVVATGHYRNGVLLAPATAQRAIDLLALPQI